MVKKTFFISFLVSLSLFIMSPAFAKRIALVIGNDNYTNVTKLQKAVNDAQSLSKVLEKIGFEVIEKVNADRRTFDQQLNNLNTIVNAGDEVVFFYAGHGISINGRNYLLPIDIPAIIPGHERSVTKEAFAEDEIINILQNRGAKVSILIIDACRNNPFPKEGTRSVGRSVGLGQRDNPPINTFVMYSAGIGQEALDRLNDEDENPNSVFTRRLIPLLQQSGLSLIRMAKTLQVEVEKLALTSKSKHRQFPAFYDQVRGDFYFVPKVEAEIVKKQEQVAIVAPPDINDPEAKLKAAERLLHLTRDDVDNLRVVAEVDFKIDNPGTKSLDELRDVVRSFNTKNSLTSKQYWSKKTKSLLRYRATELREKTIFRNYDMIKLFRAARALAILGHLPENYIVKYRSGRVSKFNYMGDVWPYRVIFQDYTVIYKDSNSDWSKLNFNSEFLFATEKFQKKHNRGHWKGYMDLKSLHALNNINIKKIRTKWFNDIKKSIKMTSGHYWNILDFGEEVKPELRCGISFDLQNGSVKDLAHPVLYIMPRQYPSKGKDWIEFHGWAGLISLISSFDVWLVKNAFKNDYISKEEVSKFFPGDVMNNENRLTSNFALLKVYVDNKLVYSGKQGLIDNHVKKLVSAFRRGLKGKLQYWSGYSGKIETYEFDLSGFNEAYKYAKSNRC